MAVIRVVILAVAVAACAWFVLGAIEAHDLDHVTNIVTQSASLTAPQARAALDQLDSASTLNPDRQVDVVRAAVLQKERRIRSAERLLEHLVRSEPMNLTAWYQLASVAGGDLPEEKLALTHIGRLVPSLRPKS